MQIITFLIIAYVVFKMLLDYESFDQKVKRMDNDPSCSLKSDKWIASHPKEWEKIKKERW